MIRTFAAWFDRPWKTWLGHFALTLGVGLIGWPFGLAVFLSGVQSWAYTFRELEGIKDDVVAGRVTYWTDTAWDAVGPWLAFGCWIILT